MISAWLKLLFNVFIRKRPFGWSGALGGQHCVLSGPRPALVGRQKNPSLNNLRPAGMRRELR